MQLIYCAPRLISNHSRFIHQSYLLWSQQKQLSEKRGETAAEFCLLVSLSYFKGSLACREILGRGADCFTFRLKGYYRPSNDLNASDMLQISGGKY
jgi:hypothetical protein